VRIASTNPRTSQADAVKACGDRGLRLLVRRLLALSHRRGGSGCRTGISGFAAVAILTHVIFGCCGHHLHASPPGRTGETDVPREDRHVESHDEHHCRRGHDDHRPPADKPGEAPPCEEDRCTFFWSKPAGLQCLQTNDSFFLATIPADSVTSLSALHRWELALSGRCPLSTRGHLALRVLLI
jgi:hypothetical protein